MTPSPSTRARREFALQVVNRLRAEGFQALFAGGCVRDLLLGIEPSDFDVATDARPEQVMPLFRRVCEVGANFGVVRVVGPPKAGEVEVATFRSDGAYLDGRRPETVVFSSPRDDAARRDFTINGMFYDPVSEEVIDYVGGQADIEARTLRAIGDPFERFREDKLRLLRAARFAARLGFAIEHATWEAMRELAESVRAVSVERIAQEFRKMLTHPTRAEAMRLASDASLIDVTLPPVGRLREVDDLWTRTLDLLAALADEADFPLAFATLLLDVGKPDTRQINERGEASYPGHAELAARTCERLGRQIKLSNDEIERSTWLVKHQGALWNADHLRDSQLKRLLVSPGIDDLFLLHRAVAKAQGLDASSIDFAERYRAEQPRGPLDPPPLMTGHDLMQAGLKPGPKFSTYLHEIRTAQLDGDLQTKDEAMNWLAHRQVSA